jgi:uncharacterized protein YkwD
MGLAACAVAVALLGACTAVDQANGLLVLNRDRAAHGVRALKVTNALAPAAQTHAQAMANADTLYHSELRLGRGECSMGENVGYGSSISQVEGAFMASPPHRANILNGSFNLVGIGVVRQNGRVWVDQLFVGSC